jgi:hypothetical protein
VAEKVAVGRFLENANRILETAEVGSGEPVTILVRDGRVIGMSIVNDWALESLRRERGAEEAYRVGRRQGKVYVEGRSETQACLLAGRTPADAARQLLAPPVRLGF